MAAAAPTRVWKSLLALVPWLLASGVAQAGVVAADLHKHLAVRSALDEVDVIIQLADREDLAAFNQPTRAQRLPRLVRALKARADRTQAPVANAARELGARNLKQLWSINALALRLPAARVQQLANHPAVQTIRLDGLLQAPVSAAGVSATPEWNLGAVKSPDLWALGWTGSGVVVGSLDTGVDALHPDLAPRYRGGTNSWFDPHGQHAAPYDAHGHGTQTMGLMVGGASGGTAIGMAPDASWIAVKQFNDAGQASYSQIHQGFQWMLDPDSEPATDDAPHVVNASWGFAGTAGQCIAEFNDDIGLLKVAGIGVVFAAGNDGPAPGSSVSPANNPQGFASGAVDETLSVASFSSRGPSACDGSVFPALAAPGANVNTTDLSFGGYPFYMNVAGTSFAAPHTAGAMALLAGAFPAASVAQLEAALRASARDLGDAGADNAYGNGLVDVLAAYRSLGGDTNTPPQIESTPVTSATQGVAYLYDVQASDAQGEALNYALAQAPAGMSIDAANGLIAWTPSASQVGSHGVSVTVSDASGLQANQSFTIAVANVNDPPVAGADSYQTLQGATLSVAAPGVLGNDSDIDGDALTAQLAAAPPSGALTLNANGGFTYTAAAGFAGTLSFGYRARDPAGALSAVATVTLDVIANRPPVTVNDSFTAPRRISSTYAARILPVLNNDSDPDTAQDPANKIAPATVAIVAGPNQGGTASVIASGANVGRISYKPRVGFRGIETLTYRVKDTRGATSNTATVSINVL